MGNEKECRDKIDEEISIVAKITKAAPSALSAWVMELAGDVTAKFSEECQGVDVDVTCDAVPPLGILCKIDTPEKRRDI